MDADIELTELDALEDTINAANKGNPEALAELRTLQIERPEILNGAGDLGRHVQQVLIDKIARGNLMVAETLLHHTNRMRRELLGDDPPLALEIAAEEVVAAWLHHWVADVEIGQKRKRKKDRQFWATSASKARKRLYGAIRFLAEIDALYDRRTAPTKAEAIDYFSGILDLRPV